VVDSILRVVVMVGFLVVVAHLGSLKFSGFEHENSVTISGGR
jgi:hypothetical protein